MRYAAGCLGLTTLLLLPGAAAAPSPTPYRVPYRLTDTQHILVRAKLNGKGPFNFIVDTGAPALYVSPAAAKKAGLTAGQDSFAPVDRLEIEGGAFLEKIQARVEEPPQLSGMNSMGLAGSRLDGILGYSILSRFRMEIDLSQTAMRWTPVAYQPLPLLGLEELNKGKKLPAGPPPANANMLQVLSRMAGMLFAKPADEPPTTRGYLGFEMEDTPAGIRVKRVLPGSPAQAAGLHDGDLIQKAGLQAAEPVEVKTGADLLKTAAGLKSDQELVLLVSRPDGPARLAVHAGKGAF